MRYRMAWVLAAVLAAGTGASTWAGIIAPNRPDTPPGVDEDSLLKQLIDRTKNGEPVNVSPAQAAACPICGEPLYRHTEPDFECLPKDKSVVRIQAVNVTCPVCGVVFAAAKQGNVNDRAGMDRDCCRHSVGQASIPASVWMCPECGYAALAANYGQEMNGAALSEETRQRVREKLSAPTRERLTSVIGLTGKDGAPLPPDFLKFATYVKQWEIPDWIKYENALNLLEGGKPRPPHSLLAKLYLESAHANRRFVCSEVGIPGLYPQFQLSLSQSIRRISTYLSAECLEIHQRRKDPLVDPTQSERDPQILDLAARSVMQKGEEMIKEQKRAPGAEGQERERARFTTGDMFVLHLRHAAFLDRMGDIPEALKALQSARDVIPRSPDAAVDDETRKNLERQTALLQRAVSDREACLTREREHLYKAADELMQALYFDEEAARAEPATNVYLIGELLRRDGREPESSLAWLKTAEELYRDAGWLGRTVAQQHARFPDRNPEDLERMALAERDGLLSWTQDAIGAVTSKAQGKTPRSNVLDAIEKVKSRVAATGAPAVQKPASGGTGVAVAPPAPPVPAPAPSPAAVPLHFTRAQLLTGYYGALKKYFEAHQQNAPTLQALVTEGLMTPEQALLDPNGKLICPESGKPLIYMSRTKIGDAQMPILAPMVSDANKLRLLGDGSVTDR